MKKKFSSVMTFKDVEVKKKKAAKEESEKDKANGEEDVAPKEPATKFQVERANLVFYLTLKSTVEMMLKVHCEMTKLKMVPNVQKKDDGPKVKLDANGEIDYSDNYIVMLHNSIMLSKRDESMDEVDEEGKPLSGRCSTAQIPEPPQLNLARTGV